MFWGLGLVWFRVQGLLVQVRNYETYSQYGNLKNPITLPCPSFGIFVEYLLRTKQGVALRAWGQGLRA